MNALTLAELHLKQAQLAEKATRLEQHWRTLPTGAKALAMGRQVKALEERAMDYYNLIRWVETRQERAAMAKTSRRAP